MPDNLPKYKFKYQLFSAARDFLDQREALTVEDPVLGKEEDLTSSDDSDTSSGNMF